MLEMTAIYVLPSEEGQPPRAILGQPLGDKILGMQAIWSRDDGCWMLNGLPVPSELGEAITEHAKALGVQW